MPVRMRKPSGSASLTAATWSSCRRSRSAVSPRATVSRGEWSVSTRYSWPSSTAASAISSIGEPPSDQSEWVWQSPRSAARSAAAASSRSVPSVALQPAQVDRLLAGQRLGDAAGGHVADAGQLGQRAGRGPLGELVGGERATVAAADRNARTR